MTTNLLTYDHPHTGSTTVLVEVPGIPVRVNIFDFAGARVGVALTTPQRRTIQVGPGDPHGTGVKIRSVDSGTQGVQTIIGGRNGSISFVSSSGGSTIQCAGSLSMGLNKKPGLDLVVPRGSFLDVRSHGTIQVHLDQKVVSLEDAVRDGLLDVKFANEL